MLLPDRTGTDRPHLHGEEDAGYDGAPRIRELTRGLITDLTVRGAWTGPARLELLAHALAPLADLPVREVVSASHLLTDLTPGQPEVVHDYLAR